MLLLQQFIIRYAEMAALAAIIRLSQNGLQQYHQLYDSSSIVGWCVCAASSATIIMIIIGGSGVNESYHFGLRCLHQPSMVSRIGSGLEFSTFRVIFSNSAPFPLGEAHPSVMIHINSIFALCINMLLSFRLGIHCTQFGWTRATLSQYSDNYGWRGSAMQ